MKFIKIKRKSGFGDIIFNIDQIQYLSLILDAEGKSCLVTLKFKNREIIMSALSENQKFELFYFFENDLKLFEIDEFE